MRLLEDLRSRLAAGREAYRASFDRTLGRGVWTKIVKRKLAFPPEYLPDLIRAFDHSTELTLEAWHQYVGEVARECPRSVPRHLRLRWVVKRLSRGGRAC